MTVLMKLNMLQLSVSSSVFGISTGLVVTVLVVVVAAGVVLTSFLVTFDFTAELKDLLVEAAAGMDPNSIYFDNKTLLQRQ